MYCRNSTVSSKQRTLQGCQAVSPLVSRSYLHTLSEDSQQRTDGTAHTTSQLILLVRCRPRPRGVSK